MATPGGRCCTREELAPLGFPALDGFDTLSLARTLDSLVRVTRRADEVVSASGPEGAEGKNPRGEPRPMDTSVARRERPAARGLPGVFAARNPR